MILWISSYPKSGNTWVRTFISTYYLSKEDKFNFELLKNIKQFPHEKFFRGTINNINSAINSWDQAQSNINDKNKLIFLKTHSALVKINDKPFTSRKHTIGGIYIVRDPRNVITSISNHYQLSFENALKFMTNNRKYLLNKKDKENYANFTFINSWSEHYRSWVQSKDLKILLIKYEDLEKDPVNTFKKIVKFVNRITKKNDAIDDKRLRNIIESISFEQLKYKERKEGFPEAIRSTQNKKINFFYLGNKNKWEKLLTPSQKNITFEIFKSDLKKLNYSD